MSSPKLSKRLITGILCVSMIFQSVPINAYAYENANANVFSLENGEIVDETAILAMETEESANEADAGKIETGEGNPEIAEIKEAETNEAKINETSAETGITGVAETEEATSTEESATTEASTYKTESGMDVLTEEKEEWEDAQASSASSSEPAYVNMTAEFPDEVFRGKVAGILESVNPGVDLTKVTKEMLAGIVEIDFSRSRDSDKSIKYIDGIQYLTGLKKIDLSYNKIEDVVNYCLENKPIEWKKLALLESINLDGNDIKALPSFYDNTKLKSLSVIENLLPKEQINGLKVMSSSGIKLPDETIFSQRIDGVGLKVQAEPIYYMYGGGSADAKTVPFTVMVGGYKSKFAPTPEFSIDGKQAALSLKEISGNKYIYYTEVSGLDAGDHRILVKLVQNENIDEITKTFKVAEQDCYPIKSAYRFSANSTDDYVDLYYPYSASNRIASLTLIDANEKEFTYPDVSFEHLVESKDYRYKDIKGNAGLYIKDNYMNHARFSMKNTVTSIPRGTYSLNVFFSGQEEPSYVLKNLINVTSDVTDNWQCALSNETIYYNDSNRNKAEITVTGTDKPVFFDIEKTEGIAVSIAPDGTNPKKAVITAGEGAGSATIKITVGNAVQRRKIVVKERIYAQTITAAPAELEIMGPGRTEFVDVAVGPAEALDVREALDVTTSDRNVFVVEKQETTDSGARLTIKSTGIGEATLTIKVNSEDSNRLTPLAASCSIKVGAGNISEIEKQELIKNAGTIYCITNVNGTRLGDLRFPPNSGWTWLEPDTQLSVKEDAPADVQRYNAQYSRDGYAPFNVPLPVAVTQITGVEVTGPKELTKGKDGKYTAGLKYKGYNVASNKAFIDAVDDAVSFEWSSDPVFTLSGGNAKSITAAAGSVNAVTEGIIKASVKVGSDVFENEYDVRAIPEHITKIKITPLMAAGNPVSYKYYEPESVLYVDEADVTDESYKIKFKIEAGTDERPSIAVEKGTFKWEINDSAFGEIKEAPDGTVHLYMNTGKKKKSGTIILRATANDIRNNYAEVFVELRDYSPIVETDKITIYKHAEAGVKLPVYPVEGNAITKISVDHEDFKIEKNTDGSGGFLIDLKQDKKDTYEKKTAVAAQITINTQMGREVKRDVKITVDTSKPKIKFAQKAAPNIFYADTAAQYKTDADYEILDIKPKSDRNTGFCFKSYDRKTGILVIEAKGLNKSTLDAFKDKKSDFCNLPLLVEYKGYGTVEEILAVSAKSSKPSIKAEEVAMMYDGRTADTYLIDAKTKKRLALSETAAVSSLTDAVTAVRKDTGITLGFTGDKSVSYKLRLSDANWTADIDVSGKIKKVQNLSTMLDKKSICLNMAHNVKANGSVPVSVSAKNSLADIVDVRYAAADSKAEQLINSGYLNVSYDAVNDKLNLGLNEGSFPQIKAGSYKLNVYAAVEKARNETIELEPAVLSISLAESSKAPKVKLSGKGQINLIDRENTAVIYTAAVSNMTSDLTNVMATGDNAKLFDAKLADGKIEVKAKAGAVINAANYVLGLELGFANNILMPASVNIKPVFKAPKLATDKKSGIIYKAVNNSYTWNLYNKGSFGEITGVTLATARVKQPFAITASDNSAITLKLADETKRTIKKGRYTVTYQVSFRGMPPNARPVTMKMSVVVK